MWTALGAIIYKPRTSGELPFSTAGCDNMSQNFNRSFTVFSTTTMSLNATSIPHQLNSR